MGVLDEAIRDHLDLRRRHGASDAEISRAEAEALGPARRDPAAGIFSDDEPAPGDEETTILDPVAAEGLERGVEAPPPPGDDHQVDTEGETAVFDLEHDGGREAHVEEPPVQDEPAGDEPPVEEPPVEALPVEEPPIEDHPPAAEHPPDLPSTEEHPAVQEEPSFPRAYPPPEQGRDPHSEG